MKDLLSENTLRALYFALVRPYMYYAIEAWYGAPGYVTNKVVIL